MVWFAKRGAALSAYRPWLEILEDRLQPGETLLGTIAGLTLLEAFAPAPDPSDLPALTSPRPVPAASSPPVVARPPAVPEAFPGGDSVSSPRPSPSVLEDDAGDFWPSPAPATSAFWSGSLPLVPSRLEFSALAVGAPDRFRGLVTSSVLAPAAAVPSVVWELPARATNSASGAAAVPVTDAHPLAFDSRTGELAIHGASADPTVQETITPAGYLEVSRAGQLHSSDPASAAFDPALAGARAGSLRAIDFDGGAGDRLALAADRLPGGLAVHAGGAAVVTQDVTAAGAVAIEAQTITVKGTVRGGSVALSGSGWVTVEAGGQVAAQRGDEAGRIDVSAGVFVSSGQLHADGLAGGPIVVRAGNVLNAGRITANGSHLGAPGGAIEVAFTGSYIDTVAAVTSTSGAAGPGGSVVIDGGATGRLYSSGNQQATGSVGGRVDLLGREVVLAGARVDASGAFGGGSVRVGERVGQAVTVTAATTIQADALRAGNGGRVAVWADQDSTFAGTVSARGGPAGGGAGGFIDVSSAGGLSYGGRADASAPAGKAGTLLLDPKTLVIDAAVGVAPQFNLIDPHPTVGGRFGYEIKVLSTDNILVTNPYDSFGGTNAGAVYLFDGTTGALLSSLVGSHPNDYISAYHYQDRDGDHMGGLTSILSNGNYLIRSPVWNNSRGAVTWGNGDTGMSGTVSDTNSLVGSNDNDGIGGVYSSNCSIFYNPVWVGDVWLLSNGNYVVNSPNWNGKRGAVTWVSGSTGASGVVSAANSLVGSNPNDQVGYGILLLYNGNYVISSPGWNDQRGAATWASGSMRVTGTISTANSLVGSNSMDSVGSSVWRLSNGNYVVSSPSWNGQRGAATWGNGSTGVRGAIADTNSLVGSSPGDQVSGG